MAKLAMVRPETTSDLKSSRLYWGAHWRIGNTYWAPRIHFFLIGCPLNCLSGSSGKKVSLSFAPSFCRKLLRGGGTTVCTSTQCDCMSALLLLLFMFRKELAPPWWFVFVLVITVVVVVLVEESPTLLLCDPPSINQVPLEITMKQTSTTC